MGWARVLYWNIENIFNDLNHYVKWINFKSLNMFFLKLQIDLQLLDLQNNDKKQE